MSRVFFVVGFFVVLSGLASGFGVSHDYGVERPYETEINEEGELIYYLQNMRSVSQEDLTLKGEIVTGGQYAEFVGESSFFVPYGEQGIEARVAVDFPEEGTFQIGVKFTPVAITEDRGLVQLAGSAFSVVPVVVGTGLSPGDTENSAGDGLVDESDFEVSGSGVFYGFLGFIGLMIILVGIVLVNVLRTRKKWKSTLSSNTDLFEKSF